MVFIVYWQALAGGAMLGLAAALLLLYTGKIAGVSGAVGGLLPPKKNDTNWRVAFLTGMVLSAFLIAPFGYSLPDTNNMNVFTVLLAGLLVGIGTRLGNGCTSGHGIIGLGRFSIRSIIATCTFMLAAIVVVFIRRKLGGL